MKRFYFINSNLDELEVVERELEAAGIATEQIHVLSLDEAEVGKHKLHEVQEFLKKDVIHSGELGALIGLVLAIIALVTAYLLGLHLTLGWFPIIVLGIAILGFCTWEGGLFGIQVPNSNFRRYMKALKHGKHILFVDVDDGEERIMRDVLKRHPRVHAAGTGQSSPRWIIAWQQRARRFLEWAP
jgi:fumarate reductase subunit D